MSFSSPPSSCYTSAHGPDTQPPLTLPSPSFTAYVAAVPYIRTEDCSHPPTSAVFRFPSLISCPSRLPSRAATRTTALTFLSPISTIITTVMTSLPLPTLVAATPAPSTDTPPPADASSQSPSTQSSHPSIVLAQSQSSGRPDCAEKHKVSSGSYAKGAASCIGTLCTHCCAKAATKAIGDRVPRAACKIHAVSNTKAVRTSCLPLAMNLTDLSNLLGGLHTATTINHDVSQPPLSTPANPFPMPPNTSALPPNPLPIPTTSSLVPTNPMNRDRIDQESLHRSLARPIDSLWGTAYDTAQRQRQQQQDSKAQSIVNANLKKNRVSLVVWMQVCCTVIYFGLLLTTITGRRATIALPT